jgi:alkylation response protein AidB-like acyl-CoA dehydrogenase
VLLEALAAQAVDDGQTRHPVLHGAVEDHWRYAQAATVASGTIEIQRMLVARAALAGEAR